MSQRIDAILDELIARYPALVEERDAIYSAYELMRDSFAAGGKLLVGGNGGSAADSNHIAGELMKKFLKERPVSEEFSERLLAVARGYGVSDGRDDERDARHLIDTLECSLPTIAVTEHSALNTAYLNDSSSVDSFAQQVNAYGRKGDTFLGISTSGNSSNVINACMVARALGMRTVGLTGRDGGFMKKRVDVCIIAPGSEVYEIQEMHLPIYHTLCRMLEEYFF